MKRVLLIAFAVMVLLTAVVPKSVLAYSDTDEHMADFEWQVIYYTNIERHKSGLEPLTAFSKLNYVADIRAREITQEMEHVRPNGSDWYTALDENNISYMSAAENIAAGQRTPTAVVDAWMNSDGHRKNILGNYSHIGVGFTEKENDAYKLYWTQMFIGSSTYDSIWIEQRGELPRFDTDTEISDIADLMCYTVAARTTDGKICYMPLMSEFCTEFSEVVNSNGSEMRYVTVNVFGHSTAFDVVIDTKGSGLIGDANGDNDVNTADAVIVLKFAAEMINLSDKQMVNADINVDNVVNTADAVAILRLCVD